MRALRTLQLGWIPLVLVAALALSGFAIYRMHGIFRSHQTADTDAALQGIAEASPKGATG